MDLSQLLVIKPGIAETLPLENALLTRENTPVTEAIVETIEFADIMTAAIVKEMDSPVVEETSNGQETVELENNQEPVDEKQVLPALPAMVTALPENPPLPVNVTEEPVAMVINTSENIPLVKEPSKEEIVQALLFADIEEQLAEIETAHKIALPDETVDSASQEVFSELVEQELATSEKPLSKVVNTVMQPESKAVINNVTTQDANPVLTVPTLVQHHETLATHLPMAVKETVLPTAVTQPEWGDHFNDHVIWLGQQKINSALIKLHPEELGPIEVHIKLVKEDASLAINTHSTAVRDLLEQAMPRLKEMMAEQGVNLSQVNIESNKNHQQPTPQQASKTLSPDQQDGEVAMAVSEIKKPQGMIDYFA